MLRGGFPAEYLPDYRTYGSGLADVQRTNDAFVIRIVILWHTITGEVHEHRAKGEVNGKCCFSGFHIVKQSTTKSLLCRLLENAKNWSDKLLLLRLQVVEEVGLYRWWKFCSFHINIELNVWKDSCVVAGLSLIRLQNYMDHKTIQGL